MGTTKSSLKNENTQNTNTAEVAPTAPVNIQEPIPVQPETSPTQYTGILSSFLSLTVRSNTQAAQYDIDDFINRLLDVENTTHTTNTIDETPSKKTTRKINNSNNTFVLKNSEIVHICMAVRELLLDQPMLLELNCPVNVVGDIHGQYEDLLRIFHKCGFPSNTNYLFLGDYVDRGKSSLETILLLFCFKLKFRDNFFLLRGNHESASINRVYGFYDECKRRTNLKIWKTFSDVFNCLPIAALISGKIFCVHGGLSPSLHEFDGIRRIQRPVEVPDGGLLNDLLWSDPSKTINDWEDSERGVSFCFGAKQVDEFLEKFDVDLVCRAHMVVEDGYEFFNNKKLVTVFSAPNYCGEFDNKGAVMYVNSDLLCSFEIIEPLSKSTKKTPNMNIKRLSFSVPVEGNHSSHPPPPPTTSSRSTEHTNPIAIIPSNLNS